MRENVNLKILDCTLRDGGYINDWKFGRKCIRSILYKLKMANIDIMEIGFLEDNPSENSPDTTIFKSVDEIDECIKNAGIGNDTNCVAMIMYGKYDVNKLPQKNNYTLQGIRYCFKKSVIDEALENCRKIREKGYEVYLQPASLTDYSDRDTLELIEKANNLDIAAFYIVDTYGLMRRDELIRYFYIIDNNLKNGIPIGFHSHNNLQLSFSNAQALVGVNQRRDLYIDSSVFGMGRGAGNLCTELFTQYINENIENKYDLIPILEIMDECIMPIYAQHPWGYSAPYYIAAINDCHPNYATYLMNRQSLCIRDINSIIKSIPDMEKHNFNKNLISDLYLKYQQHNIDDSDAMDKIADLCKGKQILILAPGKSLLTYRTEIEKYISENKPIVFAINHIPTFFNYDRIFISNLKRFKDIDEALKKASGQVIFTSNISVDKNICVVNYSTYLNDEDIISDNAGLMLINIMKRIGVRSIALAGYDGFDYVSSKNYFDEKMIDSVEYEKQRLTNLAIIEYFKTIGKSLNIKFITPSIYSKDYISK